MISVVVANQKGGVGKTTTAVMVAHGLARRGYMTLLVDLDPQGQCASLLGMEQEPGVFDLLVGDKPLRDVIRTTGRDNLFILPGNKRTATAQNITMLERRGIMVLKDSILRPFEKKGRGICGVRYGSKCGRVAGGGFVYGGSGIDSQLCGLPGFGRRGPGGEYG